VSAELAAVAGRIEEYGPVAFLVTVGDAGRPHVVSVRVAWDGAGVAVGGAGPTTRANAAARPAVTLVWPPRAGYALIVDGRMEAGRIAPARAVLHRTPDGDPSAPNCVTVLARAPAPGAGGAA